MLVRLHKLNGSEGDSRGFQQQMLDFLGGCISGTYRLIASVGAVSGSLFPNRNIQDQNPPTHSTRSSWRTWLGFQSIFEQLSKTHVYRRSLQVDNSALPPHRSPGRTRPPAGPSPGRRSCCQTVAKIVFVQHRSPGVPKQLQTNKKASLPGLRLPGVRLPSAATQMCPSRVESLRKTRTPFRAGSDHVMEFLTSVIRHILLIQILRTNSNRNFREGIVSKRRVGLFKCFLGASNSCHCSQVIPDAFALSSKTSFIVLVSGMPCGRRPTTRMP